MKKSTKSKTPALDLIKKGWTQKTYARNVDGNPVPSQSSIAVCFCSVGALIHAYPNSKDFENAYNKLANAIGLQKDDAISLWNDDPNRTYTEVIQAFEKAQI
jgi:hypothetical protein